MPHPTLGTRWSNFFIPCLFVSIYLHLFHELGLGIAYTLNKNIVIMVIGVFLCHDWNKMAGCFGIGPSDNQPTSPMTNDRTTYLSAI